MAEVFAAYFDPAHQAVQDARLDIIERTVQSLDDHNGELVRVCRVVPKRQLPLFLRPFVPGQLHYRETVRWRRADDEIDIAILPSILKGRAEITAVYRLSQVSPGEILRRYAGSVSVDVALFSTRIERGIVSEFERSMPVAAACTQAWLDRAAGTPTDTDRSLTARS
ncbi:MAG: DUF2505 family protein [Deltaproteobacteria bacterium]|nr:DUF2505 family protein [Deltaproteobacteria bacterium]